MSKEVIKDTIFLLGMGGIAYYFKPEAMTILIILVAYIAGVLTYFKHNHHA